MSVNKACVSCTASYHIYCTCFGRLPLPLCSERHLTVPPPPILFCFVLPTSVLVSSRFYFLVLLPLLIDVSQIPALLFSRSPSPINRRKLDTRGHLTGSTSPPPHTAVRSFAFIARRLQHFPPSSARIELCLPTLLGALGRQ